MTIWSIIQYYWPLQYIAVYGEYPLLLETWWKVGSLAEQKVPVTGLHLLSGDLTAVLGQEELALETEVTPGEIRPADTVTWGSTHQVDVVLLHTININISIICISHHKMELLQFHLNSN